jgi:hypothetical protein
MPITANSAPANGYDCQQQQVPPLRSRALAPVGMTEWWERTAVGRGIVAGAIREISGGSSPCVTWARGGLPL